MAISLSLFAAACGDEDDDSEASIQPSSAEAPGASSTTAGSGATSTTASTLPSDMDPDGVLRISARLISSLQQVHFDPIQTTCVCTVQYDDLIFGTLMRQADDKTLEPWMAKDVEVVDAQTVRIMLRPGVKFTDGAAYDAEAVKAGLLRTRFGSATPVVAAQVHPGLKPLASVDVVDSLTVVAHLDKPLAALFLESLAGMGGVIVSPKQVAENPAEVDTKPVGAGPYIMQKYDIDALIEYRKNPDFWDADSWNLAGIDYVQTPVGPPRITGLLADAIDVATELPISGLEALEADKDIKVDSSSLRYSALLLCHKPPFDNVAVRQAISAALDRDEYNELLFAGLGEPAYGTFPSTAPEYNPAIEDVLPHGPGAAKKLLADAGVSDVTFDLWWVTQTSFEPNAEVVQAQLKEAGITANLIGSENIYGEWIEPKKSGALVTYVLGTGGYNLFTTEVQPGAAQAYCGLDGSDVMAEANKAAGLDPADPKAIEAMKNADRIYAEQAYHIPLLFEPVGGAWNTSRVGGDLKFITLNDAAPRPRFDSIYMKK